MSLREQALASHLTMLLNNTEYEILPLIADILPVYAKKRGDHYVNLEPFLIYRQLYYIHYAFNSTRPFMESTREFLRTISGYIEACLHYLIAAQPNARSYPNMFGRSLEKLEKEGVLTKELATKIQKLNQVVNIPAKHPSTFFDPDMPLDKRTFSINDASLALVITRSISIELFEVLKASGVNIPEGWREFDEEWLQWDRKYQDKT